MSWYMASQEYRDVGHPPADGVVEDVGADVVVHGGAAVVDSWLFVRGIPTANGAFRIPVAVHVVPVVGGDERGDLAGLVHRLKDVIARRSEAPAEMSLPGGIRLSGIVAHASPEHVAEPVLLELVLPVQVGFGRLRVDAVGAGHVHLGAFHEACRIGTCHMADG